MAPETSTTDQSLKDSLSYQSPYPKFRGWALITTPFRPSMTASPVRQCTCNGPPDLPSGSTEKYGNTTTAAATQCRSNPVSGRGLLKTGIFSNIHRRLSEISPWKWPNLESGDRPPICKSPPLAVISCILDGRLCSYRTALRTFDGSEF